MGIDDRLILKQKMLAAVDVMLIYGWRFAFYRLLQYPDLPSFVALDAMMKLMIAGTAAVLLTVFVWVAMSFSPLRMTKRLSKMRWRGGILWFAARGILAGALAVIAVRAPHVSGVAYIAVIGYGLCILLMLADALWLVLVPVPRDDPQGSVLRTNNQQGG